MAYRVLLVILFFIMPLSFSLFTKKKEFDNIKIANEQLWVKILNKGYKNGN